MTNKITKNNKEIRFIDLFAGLGGTRIGFENAAKLLGYKTKCIFTSEIKKHAIQTYQKNFNNDQISGDITKISPGCLLSCRSYQRSNSLLPL